MTNGGNDVLVCSGCYNKNTINLSNYKQQKCIPDSFKGWEFQDEGTGSFGIWKSSFLVHNDHHVPKHDRRGQEASSLGSLL